MMITLSNTFGWDYFADWSGENSLKNFSAVNIETAIALAWQERYEWFPCDQSESFKRNFTTVYGNTGIAFWWKTLVPHVNTNGKYVIYDGENPPSGRDSGYGWKGIAIKGDAIPDMITPGQSNGGLLYGGSGYIGNSTLWPFALSVAEMEDLIGETILPYPYDWPVYSAGYYLQFYKIINAVKHRLFYASPPGWFTGIEDNTWSDISQYALSTLLARQNIYSVDVYQHSSSNSGYDAHLKTVQSDQIAKYSEDVYIRLVSAYGAALWPAAGEYTFYKHFQPGDIFKIDPPRIPAIPEGVPFSQAIDLISIEDRKSVADKFIFQSG